MNRLNGNGVPAKDVTNGVTLQPASALGLPRVISYRASGLVAVELLVAVPAGALMEREAEPDLAAAGTGAAGGGTGGRTRPGPAHEVARVPRSPEGAGRGRAHRPALPLPAISAAVRIQAGLMMMAHGELPRGVREALSDGPEVRGMRVTGRAWAGMAEPPRHHVLPKEFREWSEKRGFTGDMDIDQLCVKLEQAHHQAIHGGGNWKLGCTWHGEWNRMIMNRLREAEVLAGRMLTRNEILEIVAKNMRDYRIPMKFIRWRAR